MFQRLFKIVLIGAVALLPATAKAAPKEWQVPMLPALTPKIDALPEKCQKILPVIERSAKLDLGEKVTFELDHGISETLWNDCMAPVFDAQTEGYIFHSTSDCGPTRRRYRYRIEINGTTMITWLQAQKCFMQSIKHIYIGRYADGERFDTDKYDFSGDAIYNAHNWQTYTPHHVWGHFYDFDTFTYADFERLLPSYGLREIIRRSYESGSVVGQFRMLKFHPRREEVMFWSLTPSQGDRGTHLNMNNPVIIKRFRAKGWVADQFEHKEEWGYIE